MKGEGVQEGLATFSKFGNGFQLQINGRSQVIVS
jgi:hypothetical protein